MKLTVGTLVSTKKLSFPQQQLVEHSGVGLIHYDILKIKTRLVNEVPENLMNVIITSKNAIPAAVHWKDHIKNIYCVGDTTAEKLVFNGFLPQMVASDSKTLADKIISSNPDHTFTYMCGDHRRDEIPQLFEENEILLNEVIVYESKVVEKAFDRIFAAVLFYSPRGVYAFAKANKHQPQCAVCIGETTAEAAREMFPNVVIANKQTVENVLTTAIKLLRDDKK
ncbi:uroporphyrinogen-III synthase [Nonlabens antarcticus]|uniref:uroporphyrinogen-III synthase n=1 Tax=Nonlabens antarcticus TaxID=392714 RepID=UPI0018918A0C|nr:uroporphyrinogen-III synthase [Nonlabens antarcticus]